MKCGAIEEDFSPSLLFSFYDFGDTLDCQQKSRKKIFPLAPRIFSCSVCNYQNVTR